jgi:ribonuclease Z
VTFLGTAGSVPTPERNLPGILIQLENDQIMFDCGEGIQKQMIKAKVGFHKRMKIFISHMHGDHVLGLPGLLQTMSLLSREKKLEVYGPSGINRFVEAINDTVQFHLTFPVIVHIIEDTGIVCKQEKYDVKAIWGKHTIPNLVYALIEKPHPGRFYPEKAAELGIPEGPLRSELKHGHQITLPNGRVIKPRQVVGPTQSGRKIVYTGDTKPFQDFVAFAKKADLIIHDATFSDELTEKAQKDGHSTPSQAAESAKTAGARRLILTHISARYKNPCKLVDEAKKIFRNTDIAKDFMKINIPLHGQE